MAMTRKCRDCEGDVSQWAQTCPHCGCFSPALSAMRMAITYGLGGALVIFPFLLFFAACAGVFSG